MKTFKTLFLTALFIISAQSQAAITKTNFLNEIQDDVVYWLKIAGFKLDDKGISIAIKAIKKKGFGSFFSEKTKCWKKYKTADFVYAMQGLSKRMENSEFITCIKLVRNQGLANEFEKHMDLIQEILIILKKNGYKIPPSITVS